MLRENADTEEQGFGDLMKEIYKFHNRLKRLDINKIIRKQDQFHDLHVDNLFQSERDDIKKIKLQIEDLREKVEGSPQLRFALPVFDFLQDNILQKFKLIELKRQILQQTTHKLKHFYKQGNEDEEEKEDIKS